MADSDTGILSAEQNLEKLTKVLDEYSTQHKLSIKLSEDIEEYLNLSFDQLRNMPYEDIASVNVVLAGYAVYLQKEENRQTAYANWAENIIQMTAASKINNYKQDFQSYEERKMLCIVDNSYMKKLNELRIKAESRKLEIKDMAKQINKYVEAVKDLVLSKRRMRDAV